MDQVTPVVAVPVTCAVNCWTSLSAKEPVEGKTPTPIVAGPAVQERTVREFGGRLKGLAGLKLERVDVVETTAAEFSFVSDGLPLVN